MGKKNETENQALTNLIIAMRKRMEKTISDLNQIPGVKASFTGLTVEVEIKPKKSRKSSK